MDIQLIQLLKDISYPAVAGLFIMFVLKPLIPLIADWIRSKTGSIEPSIHDKLNKLENNDLHEISETLNRIEMKLDKMNDALIFLKAKINFKD